MKVVAVAGASLAAVSAVQTLRDDGFDGRVVMIGEEPHPPYERPELSKSYLRGERDAAALLARTPEWYEANAVELVRGVRVRHLDPRARALELDDGRTVVFDRAVVATGAANRPLDVPGGRLPGVLALRTLEDADRLRAAAAGGGPAVVVGMGFIGAEVAASLRTRGVEVTVVEAFGTAMWRALGDDAGRTIERLHRDHGVDMRFGRTVTAIEGDGRVERLLLSDGDRLDAAFVVVGIGVVPAAELWPLPLAPDGGILVDATLETEVPGVFAAGDVASHAHPLFGRIRVEHYDNAIRMGAAAARGVLGSKAPYDDPHWFWSEQYDVRIEMVGHAPADGAVVVRGSYDDGAFCAFHLRDDGTLGSAVGVAWPRDVRRAGRLIQGRARPDPGGLADVGVDVRSLG